MSSDSQNGMNARGTKLNFSLDFKRRSDSGALQVCEVLHTLGNLFSQQFLIQGEGKLLNTLGVLRKCANEICSNPFLYFRSGRLFHFPKDASPHSPNLPLMEAFWLCAQCCETLTLQRTGKGVVAVRKSEPISSSCPPA